MRHKNVIGRISEFLEYSQHSTNRLWRKYFACMLLEEISSNELYCGMMSPGLVMCDINVTLLLKYTYFI